MSDLEKIKTEIALLKKDAKTGELIHQRLEVAVDKLTESLKRGEITSEKRLIENGVSQEDLDSFSSKLDEMTERIVAGFSDAKKDLSEIKDKLANQPANGAAASAEEPAAFMSSIWCGPPVNASAPCEQRSTIGSAMGGVTPLGTSALLPAGAGSVPTAWHVAASGADAI